MSFYEVGIYLSEISNETLMAYTYSLVPVAPLLSMYGICKRKM